MPRHDPTRIVQVPASSLRIHPTAQRDLLPAHQKKLRENFDLDKIGVMHGVEYEIDGVRAIWIIDGQHRQDTLLYHGLGDWIVKVEVHIDVQDDARASELFLELNDRASVNPHFKYTNALKARRKSAVGVDNIVEANGLHVGRHTADGLITCVSTLVRLYDFDGGETLRTALEIVLLAWGRKAAAVEGKLIEGLGIVLRRYAGVIDKPALVKKMAKYPGGPSGLIGDARGIRRYKQASVSHCVADRIVAAYNAARHSRLDPLL